jgi:hypothetical protein
MADDDEDMGTSFMRKHMSEAQPSTERGGLGDKSRNTAPKGTDSYYNNRYGKGGDPEPGEPTVVNRADKGARGSGDIGTDSWNQNKYGGDGMSGGRKPKASQRNKEVKY